MPNEGGKKSIIICEYISTGINYVDDALERGYIPVLVEGRYEGSPEETAWLRAARDRINRRMEGRVRIIKEDPDYGNILRQVRDLDPEVIVAGSEFGVALAAMLSHDLGLKGNPVESIPAMTQKDEMQKALAAHGLRSIRGRVVGSEREAIEFFTALGKEETVVKPVRGAGSQGVHLCRGRREMLATVRRYLSGAREKGIEGPKVLVQERINGTEYVVNTVSCNGKHRVVTVGAYDKYRLSNGAIAYNYFRYVTKLGVGHSELMRYACAAADAIGIKYGPVHGEYMVDEEGPVLIEVNCRPMGGGLDRRYSELISGQHETDSALDSYLDPEKFRRDAMKPYCLKRFGVSKDLVLVSDTEVISAPVLQICRRLRSYYSASYDRIGMTAMLPQTTDMETEAGLVYLIHDDEQQVRDDCELLHLLETKYPAILFQRSDGGAAAKDVPRDIGQVMEAAGCGPDTIIFTDRPEDIGEEKNGADVVTQESLARAKNAYALGILDLSDPASFADLESVIQQIFVFTDRLCAGGRIIVPESTYCRLPYGMEGMEILFRVSGILIDLPSADLPGLLTATVREQGKDND